MLRLSTLSYWAAAEAMCNAGTRRLEQRRGLGLGRTRGRNNFSDDLLPVRLRRAGQGGPTPVGRADPGRSLDWAQACLVVANWFSNDLLSTEFSRSSSARLSLFSSCHPCQSTAAIIRAVPAGGP